MSRINQTLLGLQETFLMDKQTETLLVDKQTSIFPSWISSIFFCPSAPKKTIFSVWSRQTFPRYISDWIPNSMLNGILCYLWLLSPSSEFHWFIWDIPEGTASWEIPQSFRSCRGKETAAVISLLRENTEGKSIALLLPKKKDLLRFSLILRAWGQFWHGENFFWLPFSE